MYQPRDSIIRPLQTIKHNHTTFRAPRPFEQKFAPLLFTHTLLLQDTIAMATFEAGVLAAITGAECSIAPLDKREQLPSQAAHTIRIPRPDSVFLVLSPVTSSDYPSPTSTRTPSVDSSAPPKPLLASITQTLGSAIDLTGSADASEQVQKDRRSSSTSSYGPFKRRFLKLGPVHNGGESGVSDYVEFDEE